MAYLTLEDGTIFKGEAFGAQRDVIGEAVFNTGMAGYQEALTDPSCYGQIVTMTYPVVGNYGMISEASESGAPYVRAFVVREMCDTPSNWKSEGSFVEYCEKRGVVGLSGIDTRELTRVLRDKGTMRGIITKNPPSAMQIEEMKAHRLTEPVKKVTAKQTYTCGGGGKKIAVLDLGVRRGILKKLEDRGCELTVFPAYTKPVEILEGGFDGLLISNGPGDPKDNDAVVQNIRELVGKLPMLGIGLGHQLIALAMGADTEKLKYGHRGSNHPVKDMQHNRVYITSQNHGYVIKNRSLPDCAVVSHKSWNDRTIEGVRYVGYPMLTVQFLPGVGPADTAYIYDEFLSMTEAEPFASEGVADEEAFY